MKIKLLGVRGSLSSPSSNREYRTKIRKILNRAVDSGLKSADQINDFINSLPDNLQYYYGGNTTCIALYSQSGTLYILDCGSGVREFGVDLLDGDCGKGKGILKIFITHLHWDHIQGIPFFKPMYIQAGSLLSGHHGTGHARRDGCSGHCSGHSWRSFYGCQRGA